MMINPGDHFRLFVRTKRRWLGAVFFVCLVVCTGITSLQYDSVVEITLFSLIGSLVLTTLISLASAQMLQRFGRFRHRLGGLGTSAMMLPILIWVWLPAQAPVRSVFTGAVSRFVLSGKLFSERFHIKHAGSAFDQPTIGKWLFLFTFMAVSSLPYAGIVCWLSNRKKQVLCVVSNAVSKVSKEVAE